MTTHSPILRSLRHAHRYGEVLEVLIRYGFADLIAETKLDSLLEKGRKLVGKPKAEYEHLTRAERVRKAMEELGPTYVKLGQVLSTRPDLIHQEWADEFKKLQFDVPGVEYEVIRARLEEAFPGKVTKIFKTIQKKPLAAASMAQVHRATLRDGTKVVLKILRPDIREITAADMDILKSLAEIAEKHFANLGYSPTEVVREFAKELRKEVDLVHEGRATDRLREYFAEDEGVFFPRVFWEATTESVLALEEIHGLLLSRLTDGQIKPEDRRRLVENGARAVLRQTLELGFFHADPHPGNLIALPGGRIAFIDCGMTGQLEQRTMQQLAELISGIAVGDFERVMAVVGGLVEITQEKLEDRAFRSDVQSFVGEFQGTPLERMNIGRLLNEFFGKLRANQVKCPADLILLIKALTTIESVGAELDPAFDFVSFAQPYVEGLVEGRYSLSSLKKRARGALVRYIELFEELPNDIRPMLAQLRKNQIGINIHHQGLTKLTATIEHGSRNIGFAAIIAALLIGSSILVLAASHGGSGHGFLNTLGLAGFILAGLLAVLLVHGSRKFRL